MPRLIVIVFLSIFALSTSARAEILRIAVAQIPPYTMNQDGNVRGILVDVVRLAAERSGHDVRFAFYPWPRAVQYVKKARADAIMPFFKTKEREAYVHFPDKGILDMELALFRKAGTGVEVQALEQAMPYRIIQVNKANLGQKFSDLVEHGILRLEYAPNTESALRQVMADRVELFASVTTIARFGAQQNGFGIEIEQASPVFDKLTCFIAFAKTSGKRETFDQITAEISRLQQDGTIDKIINDYMSVK